MNVMIADCEQADTIKALMAEMDIDCEIMGQEKVSIHMRALDFAESVQLSLAPLKEQDSCWWQKFSDNPRNRKQYN